MSASPLQATFEKKYDEFIADLRVVFPEIELELACASALRAPEHIHRYYTEVYKKHAVKSSDMPCPGIVLPGVQIEPSMWATVSNKSKESVYEYLSILDLCSAYEKGDTSIGEDPSFKRWADTILKDWRSKLDRMDFNSLAEKFKDMFGSDGALPALPEKFLKGKLAKLAEDLVKEFKPEDFGLRPEDLEQVEKDPTRAFEILMQASTSRPDILQTAMTRVGKKLQDKIQKGHLKPEELAAEAEELMHEFQSHPAFAEMMKAFKSAFSFEDPDFARAAGREEKSRLAIVKNRLRAKLEAKKAAGKKK
ncbi:hypothetical protein EBR66_05930 [bacterium]|nr:hypothetical protein [bacterium]